MCLDEVTKEVVLRKDKVVYKAVKVSGKMEKTTCDAFDLSTSKILNAEIVPIEYAWEKEYDSGFHCFVSKIPAEMWSRYCVVRSYIIPKGTKVTIGKQQLCDCSKNNVNSGRTIISTIYVTPVLINPRIKE